MHSLLRDTRAVATTRFLALAFAVTASVAACTSAASSSPPVSSPVSTTVTRTVTAPRSQDRSPVRPPTSSVPVSMSAAAMSMSAHPVGATRCPASSLRLGSRGGDGAGGTEYYTFTLTNTGYASCTLVGYPGVSVIDASGRTVSTPATRGRTGTDAMPGPSTVSLGPGRTGFFLVTSVNVISNPSCRRAYRGARLRVYPPNSYRSLTLPFTQQVCALGVGPMIAKPI